MTYCDDLAFVFLASIEFLNEVFGVFYRDFMGISIKTIDYRYHIFLSAFHPPAIEVQTCYVL